MKVDVKTVGPLLEAARVIVRGLADGGELKTAIDARFDGYVHISGREIRGLVDAIAKTVITGDL